MVRYSRHWLLGDVDSSRVGTGLQRENSNYWQANARCRHPDKRQSKSKEKPGGLSPESAELFRKPQCMHGNRWSGMTMYETASRIYAGKNNLAGLPRTSRARSNGGSAGQHSKPWAPLGCMPGATTSMGKPMSHFLNATKQKVLPQTAYLPRATSPPAKSGGSGRDKVCMHSARFPETRTKFNCLLVLCRAPAWGRRGETARTDGEDCLGCNVGFGVRPERERLGVKQLSLPDECRIKDDRPIEFKTTWTRTSGSQTGKPGRSIPVEAKYRS